MRKLWRSWPCENLFPEDLWPMNEMDLDCHQWQDLKREHEECDLGASVNGKTTSAVEAVFLDVASGCIFYHFLQKKCTQSGSFKLCCGMFATHGAWEKTDAHVFFLFLTDPLLICSIVFLLSFFDVINLADRIPLKRPLHGALQGWMGISRVSGCK